ncbi:MAG: N-acetylmuramic acid 6-phosphate etherase [Phycisphaerae bacterium]|jgi:N-acetylmuramic acid 6-phosphate etherase|nr:N-acetylmuramic acid 6-phosphate etherase [Phycisphaerae bacterium]
MTMKDRSKLTTEKRNPRSRDIDCRSALEIVDIINSEDARIAPAVHRERRKIAKAVRLIVEAFRRGARLFYVGAGTSGRLGVLDASECPPTFGSPPSLVQGIIAGGRRAMVRSIEGAEDKPADGAAALDAKRACAKDVVVGIAACGLTPFVHGAMKRGRQIGCPTIFITCAPETKKQIAADVVIAPAVGPEVVTGSTRMKAGTATKLVLNTLTTAAMIQTGKVYGNLMVDLRAVSEKLRDRSERIVMEVTGLGRRDAARLLERARGMAKPAILMHMRGLTFAEARRRLERCGESLRDALEE